MKIPQPLLSPAEIVSIAHDPVIGRNKFAAQRARLLKQPGLFCVNAAAMRGFPVLSSNRLWHPTKS